MLTALIIALAATVAVAAALTIAVLTGWFPRLAARAARGLALLSWRRQPRRLDPRERAELIARLWIPWLAL
jgi:hypothetical protein